MKLALLTFFTSLWLVTGNTQFITPYDTTSIYLQAGHYIKNGQKYPYGFFGNKLKAEMQVNKDAALSFHKFQEKQKYAALLSAITTISFFVILNDTYQYNETPFWVLGITSGVGGMLLSRSAYNHLHKAVWYRNRTYQFE
jgi:hypothetical protein